MSDGEHLVSCLCGAIGLSGPARRYGSASATADPAGGRRAAC